MSIRRLAVIGVGFIGGSLARALRAAGAVEHIVGCDHDAANLNKALTLGVVDTATAAVATAVRDCDRVFLAVPMGAMRAVMQQMVGHLAPDCVVTDGGSTKASVVADWRAVFGDARRFVPGHPIAGAEHSGVEHACAELYRHRRVILTPQWDTDAAALDSVQAMWAQTGALVSRMDVAHHDHVLAATSHAPHVLAFALVAALAKRDDAEEVLAYAAGGFRDFTRIAAGNPRMWHDICLANSQAIEGVLADLQTQIDVLRQAVAAQDGPLLIRQFATAKAFRDQLACR